MPIRILIADDHPIVREGLTAVLETQPDFVIVGAAASGTQAVERTATLRPDVILLDLALPELDGVAALRQKYAPKVAALQERLRRAQQSVEKEKAQASAQWVQSGLQIGATVLGAFLGRKTFSTTNIGKASTAVRGMGRAYEQSSDVGRAEETSSSIQGQIDGLNTDLQSEIAALDVTYNPQAEKLETVTIKPKRTGIQVKLVALTWVGR